MWPFYVALYDVKILLILFSQYIWFACSFPGQGQLFFYTWKTLPLLTDLYFQKNYKSTCCQPLAGYSQLCWGLVQEIALFPIPCKKSLSSFILHGAWALYSFARDISDISKPVQYDKNALHLHSSFLNLTPENPLKLFPFSSYMQMKLCCSCYSS